MYTGVKVFRDTNHDTGGHDAIPIKVLLYRGNQCFESQFVYNGNEFALNTNRFYCTINHTVAEYRPN